MSSDLPHPCAAFVPTGTTLQRRRLPVRPLSPNRPLLSRQHALQSPRRLRRPITCTDAPDTPPPNPSPTNQTPPSPPPPPPQQQQQKTSPPFSILNSNKPSKPPPSPTQPLPPLPPLSASRPLLAIYYLAFVIYFTFLAPGSLTSLELEKILAFDFTHVNDAFFAIFILLLPTTLNFAIALNPGSSRQKQLPDKPFLLAAQLLGFLALGPYLIFRNYVPSITRPQVQQHGVLSRILEGRLVPVLSAAISLWVYLRVFGAFSGGGEMMHDIMFYSSFVNLTRIIPTDRFVASTCADFATLSVLMWGPLTEDMRRRGWFVPGRATESYLTAATILATPAFGPALYFILRPQLPESLTTPSSQTGADEDSDDNDD